ncbi:hypothetical protein IWQ47_001495 [Aquimarina sp. EL_43]|uniref:S41 family peptidase n=1 Tax=unclassified Aquimarina TaxID=2627091 RepID=UPI0018CBCAD4|nr:MULTISPECIES: S41 family peptidase [unclassified Aquimarina]MBG6130422.1 hypothetical protein [Aquimarina sp. EL_35]MBG6149202.1 hypothetical protein [Aquimarina sp. EL_32]MBG6168424.1 hypothetical protein [Aquimarina sp. EL_43]
MMKNIFRLPLLGFLLVLIIGSCSKDDDVTIPDGNSTLIEQQKVFKEFWEIYDRHYPLMHRKNIDWQNVYDTYYPKITSTTSDNQLFGIFETIMGTIVKDGHSSLTFNANQEAGFEPEFDRNIQNMIQNNTAGKVSIVSSSANNPYLSYGTVTSDSNIGYINSKNFEPVNENDSEFNNFKAIVDEALTALQNKAGIIIDVRTNGGGQGPFAYYLAGRFFTNNTPIELIRQRIKTSTGSTVASLGEWATKEFEGYPDARVEGGFVAGVFPEDNTIVASGAFQFTKKVAVLTSKGTASAAEYFTAAMKTQSHSRTIGSTTFGIFAGSDIFTLTNGGGKWKTRVSTHDVEIKYNNTFQSFEGIGITPDILSIPTTAQVTAGEDIHIVEAVRHIKN